MAYQPKITNDATGSYYALIVYQGKEPYQESVIHGYKGRYFKTRKAAEKSTRDYMNKHNLMGAA